MSAKFSFMFPYSRSQFSRNFKCSDDRERPLTTIWKPGFIAYAELRILKLSQSAGSKIASADPLKLLNLGQKKISNNHLTSRE